MSKLHVLIAGGGIGGLCLAQGLKKAGISCAVYERDQEGFLRAGYRLHMNADGGNALRACLPDNLYELYVQTSRRNPRREIAAVLDSQLHELSARPHIGPPNDPVLPHTAVNRLTLLQILHTGIEDVVHYGAAVVGFEEDGSRVRVLLEDGTSAVGDVLVVADGIGSAVRRQLLPDVKLVETEGFALYTRAPLTPKIVDELPEALFDGFVAVTDGKRGFIGLGIYEPRTPVSAAVAELAPGAKIDAVAPYTMLAFGKIGPMPLSPEQIRVAAPDQLHAIINEATSDWHPAIRTLVESADISSTFAQPIRMLAEPPTSWTTSHVTLIGDAVHAMPPTFGAGANLALRDAAILCSYLQKVERGESELLTAIAGYEEEMRAYDYPIHKMSTAMDEDEFNPRRMSQGGRATAEARDAQLWPAAIRGGDRVQRARRDVAG